MCNYKSPSSGLPPQQQQQQQWQDLAYNNQTKDNIGQSYGKDGTPSHSSNTEKGDGQDSYQQRNQPRTYGESGRQPSVGRGMPSRWFAVGSPGFDSMQQHIRPHGLPLGAPAPCEPDYVFGILRAS